MLIGFVENKENSIFLRKHFQIYFLAGYPAKSVYGATLVKNNNMKAEKSVPGV